LVLVFLSSCLELDQEFDEKFLNFQVQLVQHHHHHHLNSEKVT